MFLITDPKIRTGFFIVGAIFGVLISAAAIISIVISAGPAWIRILAIGFDIGFLLGIISGQGE
jgi:hypothetical protein